MTKILVLYYSMYGHIATLAQAEAEGVRAAGAEAVIKRVPEHIPAEALQAMGATPDTETPIAEPGELVDYDGILLGSPTRFGQTAGQIRNFWDQTGKLWMEGKLIGKPAGMFTGTGTGAGNESTILGNIPSFLHHGMIFVGVPYAAQELTDISAARGGSPYGAGALAGPDGSRAVSDTELAIARFQGKHFAEIAAKLKS
ncbi:MAG: NAD(P)H:quinone oxidoreductase [Rhodospirillaceae bacterium]